ncbi:CdaR family protein [Hyunsoonleella sp. 2307UL5-6]|uniref:CdaR family protein n=1 Tax=Hyunsoonleella sp. 2307UL5-6 TaxID=3384768 RepID=UPI0039BCB88E
MIRKLKSELVTSIKNKRLNVFLLFLFSAFIILIFTKLSKDYTSTLNFAIKKVNVPRDKVILNDSSHKLQVTLKTHGFKWLKYYFTEPDISIDFSNEVYKKQNTYVYTKSVSYLNEKKPFRSEVKLLNINPDTLVFRYDTNLVKKVAVNIETDISFFPGFDIVDDYKITPDSVTIIGPEELVNAINVVNTEKIILTEIKSNISIKAKLNLPKNTADLKFSDNDVQFTANVEKFTEGVVTIPIQVINLPQDVSIKYFPKEVKVSYYTSLKNFNSISAKDFKVKCDFNKVDTKQSVLIPELVKLPSNVKHIKLNQKRIEFIILK